MTSQSWCELNVKWGEKTQRERDGRSLKNPHESLMLRKGHQTLSVKRAFSPAGDRATLFK